MKLPEPSDDPTWSRIRAHDVEELWDHSRSPHVAASYRARMELLAGIVQGLVSPSDRVLDVGCAQGTLGLMLGERGLKVDLLDVRAESVAYARARYESGDVRFHVGSVSATCPASNDYGVVICTEVLEHVPAPAEFLRALKEKARRGGALCLTTPNADYLFSKLPTYGRASQATIDDAEPNSMDGDAHRYLYTREDLVVLIRSVGLRLERHGFFLPAWLEGHAKTRQLHRWYYAWRHHIVQSSGVLPQALGRRLCSSQFIVARRD